jgi:Zn-dependent membrane protease YugP
LIFDPNYMIFVMLPTLALSLFAQWRVKSAYNKWSRVPNQRGIDSVETARIIMQHVGLEHVEIDRVRGQLTDHYDPRDKSIHLSDSTVGHPSVAAMAITAHELGHAEQDKVGNAMLNLRASLVPAANLGSNLGIWVVFGGLMLNLPSLAWVGVLLFGAAVAFTLVTLPVEFDASRRAKRYLRDTGLVTAQEHKGVDAVLDAAALTYVAAAASSLLTLLYYVSLISGRND